MGIQKRRFAPVCLTLCIGAGTTLFASINLWQGQREIQQNNLHAQLNDLQSALQQSININLESLQNIAALYDASENISRQEFANFVGGALDRHPSILSLGWGSYVPANQRQAYEQAMQATGLTQFRISQRTPEGEVIAATDRPEYFPVTYREPAQDRNSTLGFDLGSEPSRRSAVERARDSGDMSTTGRIAVVSTQQTGFLVLHPVYRQGAPTETVTQRRQNFLGVIIGSFQTTDVLKAALPGVELDHLHFYVYDGSTTAENRLLAAYRNDTGQISVDLKQEPTEDFTRHPFCQTLANCSRTLLVGDREWTLLLLPESHYADLQTYSTALATLGSGLVLTLLLAGYLYSSVRHTVQVEALVQERTAQTKQVQTTLRELQKTQAQLIQTEKMSSLGQLVAGIAHEINNPINFIHGNLSHTQNYVNDLVELMQRYQLHYPIPEPEITACAEAIDLDFLLEDLPKLIGSMKSGTNRIRQIVVSLQNFSRADQSEVKFVDIHEGIESTLLILQSRLKAKADRPAIEVIKKYGNLPLVECFASQLNQVFMNVINNAIDALEAVPVSSTLPTITIYTALHGYDRVRISITDTGTGMTEDTRQHLFDPFFTTKPVGKGTGLGLSISYQIVTEKHSGSLYCQSQLGKGSEFCIEIPLHQAGYSGNSLPLANAG